MLYMLIALGRKFTGLKSVTRWIQVCSAVVSKVFFLKNTLWVFKVQEFFWVDDETVPNVVESC
jgi:hypothetical protein